jgi:alkyl hydroperoxide reductase subunit D
VSPEAVIAALAETLPPYAADIARGLSALAAETTLTGQQKWGTYLASACAAAVPAVLQATEAAAVAGGLNDAVRASAKGAAAVMAQNNVYFRAVSLLKNQEYRAMRSGLRMNIVFNPGFPKDDFDLWCVAVSAINGCPDCLDSHEGDLRKRGVSAEAVQAALRIASVVHATGRVLAAEAVALG